MPMNWEDERYVRLYTRETPTWRMLPWQGRAVLPLLLKHANRAGVIDLGAEGLEGLSVLVGLPLEVLQPGLEALIAKDTATLRGTSLVLPKFVEAQETPQSDAARKRAQRERFRDLALFESQIVTKSHVESRAVTPYRAVSAVLSVPSVPPTPPRKAGDGQGDGLGLMDALDAVHREVRGRPFEFAERDGRHPKNRVATERRLFDLEQKHGLPEIVRRLRNAFTYTKAYTLSEPADLVEWFPRYATPESQAPPGSRSTGRASLAETDWSERPPTKPDGDLDVAAVLAKLGAKK